MRKPGKTFWVTAICKLALSCWNLQSSSWRSLVVNCSACWSILYCCHFSTNYPPCDLKLVYLHRGSSISVLSERSVQSHHVVCIELITSIWVAMHYKPSHVSLWKYLELLESEKLQFVAGVFVNLLLEKHWAALALASVIWWRGCHNQWPFASLTQK